MTLSDAINRVSTGGCQATLCSTFFNFFPEGVSAPIKRTHPHGKLLFLAALAALGATFLFIGFAARGTVGMSDGERAKSQHGQQAE